MCASAGAPTHAEDGSRGLDSARGVSADAPQANARSAAPKQIAAPCAKRVSSLRGRQKGIKWSLNRPDGILQEAMRSRSSTFSPTTTIPPTISECPLRYLVVECMTKSKPCSNGRCVQGLCKSIIAGDQNPFCPSDGRNAVEVDDFEHRIGRRLEPHQARVRTYRAIERFGIGKIDVGRLDPG